MATKYRIIENTVVNINGAKTPLVRNVTIRRTPCGGIAGVEGEGSEIDLDEGMLATLTASGVLEEIEAEADEGGDNTGGETGGDNTGGETGGDNTGGEESAGT